MLGLAKATPQQPTKPVAMDYATWARTHRIRETSEAAKVTDDSRPLLIARPSLGILAQPA
jgi:hypothetical protein